MASKAKTIAGIILFMLILVSCSPQKNEFEESTTSAESIIPITYNNPYGPKEVCELNALDVDFLDQAFQLPYYKDITIEQLEYNFAHSTASFLGVSVGVNAVMPEAVLCGRGNFIYNKLSGKFSRSCTDPQCRHISYSIQSGSGICPYTQMGRCVICGDTVYMSRIGLGSNDISTDVSAMDHTFRDHYYVDLPQGCTIEGETEDGRLVLRREQFVTFIDDNGVQWSSQGNYELYLYDKNTRKAELVFAPESVFFVKRSKSSVYCTMYPEYTVYAFTGDFREPINLGKIKMLAFLDHAMCYYDTEARSTYRFDELTGEKTLWANEDSPLSRINCSVYCGEKLYFTRNHTAEEINAMDFIPESQKNAERIDTSIIYCCGNDGSDIEIVYYVPGYTLDGFSIDGGVIYSSGKYENKGKYFSAYDMTSGVELRVSIPLNEYHYPGEYEYNENWRRAFN